MTTRVGAIELSDEEKFRLISDFAYDWEEWRDPCGELLYISPSCERITGYSSQEFMDNPGLLTSIVHPEDLEKYLKHREESCSLDMGAGWLEFRLTHRCGEEHWISHYCNPVFYKDGSWIGRRESNRDVTNRKRMEAELNQTEQQLDVVLSNIPTIVFGLDGEGQPVYANQAAAQMAGFQSPQDLIAYGPFLNLFEITDINGNPSIITQLPVNEAVQALADLAITARFRRIDSDYVRWAIVTGRPIYSNDGKLEMLVVIVQDISELKESQDNLMRSHSELESRVKERTQALADINQDLLNEIAYRKSIQSDLQNERDFSDSLIRTMQIGLLVLDTEGKVLQMNPFLETLTGYSFSELHQQDWFDILPLPEDKAIHREVFQKTFSGIINNGLVAKIVTKTGEIRLIQWFVKTLVNESGSALGMLAVGQDVTERQQMEEKLVKNAQQSEALAGIITRINSNLDLETVLNVICEELLYAIPNMSTATIMLVNEDTDELYFAAGSGQNLDLKQLLDPVPRQYIEDYHKNFGSLILIPDLQMLTGIPNFELAQQVNARTVISVLMTHQEQILGLINLITKENIGEPTSADLAFIKTLASHATIAIVNARLFQQVSESQKRLKVLSQRLVQVQESERKNLAREFHDVIGQELTSLVLLLEVVKNTCNTGSVPTENTARKIEQSQELVNTLLGQIRVLSLDLRPGSLDDLGLLPALLMHFERFTEQTNIKILFKHSGIDRRFPSLIETTSFRVVQEALTNVARHAQVNQAAVRVWTEDNLLSIQVQDSGVGFIPEEILLQPENIGLLGMQERVALCGGQLEIESEPGMGTCLTIELPVSTEKKENQDVYQTPFGG